MKKSVLRGSTAVICSVAVLLPAVVRCHGVEVKPKPDTVIQDAEVIKGDVYAKDTVPQKKIIQKTFTNPQHPLFFFRMFLGSEKNVQKLDAAKRHYKGGKIPAYVDIHADINSAQNLEAPVESATTITARGMIAQTTANAYPLKCEGNLERPPGPPGIPGPPGPPPKEFHWEALVKERECDYEDSGTEPVVPPGTVEIRYKDRGIQFYDIDVIPEGHRMGDVNAQLHKPIGEIVIRGPTFWGQPRRPVDPHDCPRCDDPCWRAEIWWERLGATIWYHMEMPRWLQADAAGPTARQAWQNFYDALLKHEQGHVRVLKNYYDGDGKKAIEEFVKKKYWGEAHLEGRARKLATDPYMEAFKAILSEYDRLQKAYHETQEGQPTPLPDPHLPCDE